MLAMIKDSDERLEETAEGRGQRRGRGGGRGGRRSSRPGRDPVPRCPRPYTRLGLRRGLHGPDADPWGPVLGVVPLRAALNSQPIYGRNCFCFRFASIISLVSLYSLLFT